MWQQLIMLIRETPLENIGKPAGQTATAKTPKNWKNDLQKLK